MVIEEYRGFTIRSTRVRFGGTSHPRIEIQSAENRRRAAQGLHEISGNELHPDVEQARLSIDWEISKAESRQAAIADAALSRMAFPNRLERFLMQQGSPLVQKRAAKTLNLYTTAPDLGTLTRAAYVEARVGAGWAVMSRGGHDVLASPSTGAYVSATQISTTAINYARFLMENPE